MDQVFSERPHASASALAGRRGLGDWVRTYASKQGRAYKKWRDWRLYVYAEGLVVTAPDGFEAAHDWATCRVLRYLRSVNGAPTDARYTLIGPDGDAVNIGLGTRAFREQERERLGITSTVSGAPFLHPHDWGEDIQRGITRVQLPQVLARFERGETVDFGPYRADRHGLTGTQHAAAWQEITEFSMHQATLTFNRNSNRTTLDAEPAHSIPNFDLFLHLCLRLTSRAAGTPAMRGHERIRRGRSPGEPAVRSW